MIIYTPSSFINIPQVAKVISDSEGKPVPPYSNTITVEGVWKTSTSSLAYNKACIVYPMGRAQESKFPVVFNEKMIYDTYTVAPKNPSDSYKTVIITEGPMQLLSPQPINPSYILLYGMSGDSILPSYLSSVDSIANIDEFKKDKENTSILIDMIKGKEFNTLRMYFPNHYTQTIVGTGHPNKPLLSPSYSNALPKSNDTATIDNTSEVEQNIYNYSSFEAPEEFYDNMEDNILDNNEFPTFIRVPMLKENEPVTTTIPHDNDTVEMPNEEYTINESDVLPSYQDETGKLQFKKDSSS